MRTEELIQRLGNDLRPVHPLPPPWRRAAAWLACGGVYVLTFVVVGWVRRGRFGIAAHDDAYVVQQLALIGTAIVAALAAFASVIPAADRRVFMAPVVAGMIVLAALLWHCVADVQNQGTLGWGRETDWPCVISIAAGSVVLWSGAMAMLRRGAPLVPHLSSLLAGVAAVSLVNLEACVSRPHEFGITVLLWHGMTTALMLVTLSQTGRGLLRWRRAEAG
jgi:hypothetical protein